VRVSYCGNLTVSELTFRAAVPADLETIVAMLADDPLGGAREQRIGPLPDAYRAAFAAIQADPNNDVLLACHGNEIVGTLQLTFTPSLSYMGGWRATIESVRTVSTMRGSGIGSALVRHAIERARARDCVLVQLSSHASRKDAQRFYERLGFAPSHVGMKLLLTEGK
jgi:ribosomal protein S18 acetylase RimI-like enzyme